MGAGELNLLASVGTTLLSQGDAGDGEQGDEEQGCRGDCKREGAHFETPINERWMPWVRCV